jgi:cytochrome P450 family 2 subfamily J
MKESAAQMESNFQEDSLRTFGDHYIHEIKKHTEANHGSTFSGQEGWLNLVNVLMDLFIAGSETTSTTLNWAMFFMLKHPDICKRVQEELDSVFGAGQAPAAHDRDKTPYTEAVIHEIQRMGNILMVVAHAAGRGCTLAGYQIPKGCQV